MMLQSKQPKNIQQLRELRNALPSDVSNGKVWIHFLTSHHPPPPLPYRFVFNDILVKLVSVLRRQRMMYPIVTAQLLKWPTSNHEDPTDSILCNRCRQPLWDRHQPTKK